MLPQPIKFLHPYIQSLANPSRHTIVYSVSNSKPLLSALSQFVLKCCGGETQFPALVSFWASTTAEATVTMLDQARSARREAQVQNEEDTLIFFLPILNAALAIQNTADLRVGCYMILSILASKTRLEESVLTAMMEAVVFNWHADTRTGLVCLTVLAEKRPQYKLPRKVLKALLSLPSLKHDLLALSGQYQVNRLVLGLIVGILRNTEKPGEVERLNQVEDLLDASIIDEASSSIAIGSLLSTVAKSYTTEQRHSDVRGHLCDLVFRLAKSPRTGNHVRMAVSKSKLELGQLRSTVESLAEGVEMTAPMLESEENREIDEQDFTRDFDTIVSQFAAEETDEISFLSNLDSTLYASLAESFCAMPMNNANLARFSDLPVLRKAPAGRTAFSIFLHSILV